MESSDGEIFVIANDSMEGHVCIGFTKDVNKQLANLNKKYPAPKDYYVVLTYKTNSSLFSNNIHLLFDIIAPEINVRDEELDERTNFYAISSEKAVRLLSAIADIQENTAQLFISDKDTCKEREPNYVTDNGKHQETIIDFQEDNGSINENKVDNHPMNQSIPPLPEGIESPCKFIKAAMRNLEKSGYRFTEEMLDNLQNADYSHDTFHMAWTEKPFLEKDSSKTFIGTHYRYWVDPFIFNGQVFYIWSQWYDHNKHRERFTEWYNSLK